VFTYALALLDGIKKDISAIQMAEIHGNPSPKYGRASKNLGCEATVIAQTDPAIPKT